MLILNLQSGFEIVGTFVNRKRVKVLPNGSRVELACRPRGLSSRSGRRSRVFASASGNIEDSTRRASTHQESFGCSL